MIYLFVNIRESCSLVMPQWQRIKQMIVTVQSINVSYDKRK